jgi:hypothetical protein
MWRRSISPFETASSLVLIFGSLGTSARCEVHEPESAATMEAPGSATASAVQTDAASNFLPLTLGNKWTLRHSKSRKQIVLTVKSVHDGLATVTFENPWMTSEFVFEQRGAATVLKALGIAGLEAPMPPNTLYFDFGAPQGSSWKNGIGTIRVMAVGQTIGGYTDCTQFEETNKQGHKNYWTFGRNKGFVQFGLGQDAFDLDGSASVIQASTSQGSAGSAAAPLPAPASDAPLPSSSSPSRQGWRGIHIALANNTAANEWMTPASVNRRFSQAVAAGVNYVYLSPKWAELEPYPGRYKFKDLDFQVDQADKAGLPLVLNLRVIDTGTRTLPSDLKDLSFSDQRVIDRLNRLIDETVPHLKGRLAYLLIGNEVDGYFRARPSEIKPYGILFANAKVHAKSRLQQVATSVTITIDGLQEALGVLRPLLDQGDFFSITYYPLTPNFLVRDPSVVEREVDQILRTAGRKQVLFQEFGYPSSEKNGSSQDKQAQFVGDFLDAIARRQDRILGANYLFMCDFSDSVTSGLAKAYQMPNVDQFSAFLQTLGLFDGHGNSKKSWAVFSAKATQITHAR